MDFTTLLTLTSVAVAIIFGIWQVNLARAQIHLADPFKNSSQKATLSNSCAKKIPPCEDLSWHPKAVILENRFKNYPHLYIWGTSGCGSTQMGWYLLKKFSFPPNSDESNCHFISIELRSYKNFSEALDVFFSSIGASSHSALTTFEKIQKIQRIAQDKDLAILIQDTEVLVDSEKEDLRSLIKKIAERAHLYIASAKPFPDHWSIDDEMLSVLSLQDIKNYAQSVSTTKGIKFNNEYIEQLNNLHSITNGHYECVEWALRAENSNDLIKRIEKLKKGSGAMSNVIRQYFRDLSDSKKTLLCLLVQFGGTISRLTFSKSNPFDEIDVDVFLKELAENLVVSEYPSDGDFYIKISQGNMESINSFQYEISDIVVEQWGDRLIQWYQSLDEVGGTSAAHSTFSKEIEIINRMSKWLINKGLFVKVDKFYRATCELLFNQGFFEQRVQYGTYIAQALESNGYFQSASWIYSSSASVSTLLGQYDEAQKYLAKALEIAEKHGFVVEKLRTDRAIAGLHYRKGALEFAVQKIDRLLTDNNIDMDKSNKIDALYVKSGLNIFNGNYQEARKTLEEMKLLSIEIGWIRGGAYADLDLANLFAVEGKFSEAYKLANSALIVSKKYNDRRQMARCHLSIGKIVLARSRYWIFSKPSSSFNNGIQIIKSAHQEFDSLRMDNEANEAKLTLKHIEKVAIGKTMPFKLYYGFSPIGGD